MDRKDREGALISLKLICIHTKSFHVLQVKFSADGNFLYTGARKDSDILCWDVRYTSDVVYRLQRQTADTNQRIQFDIEPMGRHLTTGSTATYCCCLTMHCCHYYW